MNTKPFQLTEDAHRATLQALYAMLTGQVTGLDSYGYRAALDAFHLLGGPAWASAHGLNQPADAPTLEEGLR